MRPFCSVIVWTNSEPRETEVFFTVSTKGAIREIKSHKRVTRAQFREYVSFALYLGKRVDFEVCNADFKVVQRATVN